MILCGITALLLSCAHAGAVPVVAAIKPGVTGGILPKKIKVAEQDDKNQSTEETAEDEEARSSLMDKEIQTATNVFAAPHRDATVQLKISGFSQLDLAMTSQDQTDTDKKGTSNVPYFHIGNTNLKMEASVKTDKMVAGWLVRFNPQINSSSIVDRNGIFWKHDTVGQFDAGNIKGVDDSLFKFAQGLIGGSNGWDSSLDAMFYLPKESYYCEGTDFVGSTHTATKISYITPKIGDIFTIAASYTPSTAHRGNMKMNAFNHAGQEGAKSKNNPNGFSSFKAGEGKYEPFGTNSITLVARLDKKCGDWTYGGAFAYIHDSAEIWAKNGIDKDSVDVKHQLKDTSAFGVSGLIGYGKFKFGIEYMNNGKSRLPINDDLLKAQNWAETTEQNEKDISVKDKDGKPKYTVPTIYRIKDGDKGHAGHVITTTVQYKWTEKLTCAYGYQWTYRKLNDESNTTRRTFTKTVNYRFMPGLEGYVEGDLIFLKNKDKDGENKDNSNVGFVVVAGVRVNI